MVKTDKICCSQLFVQVFWQQRGMLKRQLQKLSLALETQVMSNYALLFWLFWVFFSFSFSFCVCCQAVHPYSNLFLWSSWWSLIIKTSQVSMCPVPKRNVGLLQRLLTATLSTLCTLNTHCSNQPHWWKEGVTSLQQTEILLVYISPIENIIQLIIDLSVAFCMWQMFQIILL